MIQIKIVVFSKNNFGIPNERDLFLKLKKKSTGTRLLSLTVLLTHLEIADNIHGWLYVVKNSIGSRDPLVCEAASDACKQSDHRTRMNFLRVVTK